MVERPLSPCQAPSLSDAQLLILIARRDQEAFTAFSTRHQSRAYNLALRITRQPVGAEEALQEALLRVWKHASLFKPEGSPRSWLLRIVARESVRWLRKDSHRIRTSPSAGEVEPTAASREPSQLATQAEMVERLRTILDGLPALEQQILALYYASGLTQEEVGQALDLPQRTVSKKLSRLLEHFREQLRGSRHVAPALLAAWLADLLTSGCRPPPGTVQVPQASLGSASPGISARGARTGALLFSSWLPLLGAGILALGALALRPGLVATPATSATPAVPQAVPGGPAVPVQLPGPAPLGQAETEEQATRALALIPRLWSFERQDWTRELPRFGPWKMGNLSGRQHLMALEFKRPMTLLLPGRIPPAPFEVRLALRPLDTAHSFSAKIRWRRQDRLLPGLDWVNPAGGHGNGFPVFFRFVLFGRFALLYQEGNLLHATEYEAPYPAEELAVELNLCALQEIAIRPAPLAEIPKSAEGLGQSLERLHFLKSAFSGRACQGHALGEGQADGKS